MAGGLLTPELTVDTTSRRTVSREAAQGYADAVVSCQDVRGEIESRRNEYPNASDADVESYIDCIGAIDPEVLAQAVLASALREQDKATTAYADRTAACTRELGPRTR